MQDLLQNTPEFNAPVPEFTAGFAMRNARRPQTYALLKQPMEAPAPQPVAPSQAIDETPEFIAAGAVLDFASSLLEAFSSKPAAKPAPRQPMRNQRQKMWAGMMGPSFA